MCVPTVYSKDKWAIRRLSDTELADVLDLPGTMRKRMNSRQLGELSKLKVPGMVISAVIESLVAIVAKPDAMKGTARSAENASRKRSLEWEDQESHKRMHVGTESTGETDSTILPTNGHSEGRVSSPLDKEAGASIVNLWLSTVVDKAVMSDDAAAPVHLFDRRVLEGFPFVMEKVCGNASDGRLGWVEALELLRKFSLRIWTRKVRRDFVVWLANRRDRRAR